VFLTTTAIQFNRGKPVGAYRDTGITDYGDTGITQYRDTGIMEMD